jgi:hypothetical protein
MAWETGAVQMENVPSDGSQYASMSYRDIAKLYGIRLVSHEMQGMPLQKGVPVLKRNGCYSDTETEMKQ